MKVIREEWKHFQLWLKEEFYIDFDENDKFFEDEPIYGRIKVLSSFYDDLTSRTRRILETLKEKVRTKFCPGIYLFHQDIIQLIGSLTF